MKVTLAEVCGKGQYGLVASATDLPVGPKFLRTTDMIGGSISWDSVPYCEVDERKQDQCLLREGDLVVSRTGANAGAAAYVADPPEGAVFAGYLVRFRADGSRADARFLGYVLQSREWADYVTNTRTGSAQPQLNAVLMGEFAFDLPPLDEQRRIAEVLGALDDLIDTNERLKSKLDDLARTAFLRAWDGVTWVTLGDLGEILMGQSPPGDTYSEVPVGMPFHQGVRDFGARFPRSRIYCSAPTRVAEAGDILIAVRAPVGEMNVAPERLAIGRGLAALRAARPSTALQAIRAFEATWSAHQGTGTVFSSINGKDLRSAKVPHVDDDRVEGALSELDHAYAELEAEVAELRRTRDELVPLLMSGAVRVRPEGVAA